MVSRSGCSQPKIANPGGHFVHTVGPESAGSHVAFGGDQDGIPVDGGIALQKGRGLTVDGVSAKWTANPLHDALSLGQKV